MIHEIRKPPFLACRASMSRHHTMAAFRSMQGRGCSTGIRSRRPALCRRRGRGVACTAQASRRQRDRRRSRLRTHCRPGGRLGGAGMRRTDAQQGFSSAAADADVIVVGCGPCGPSQPLWPQPEACPGRALRQLERSVRHERRGRQALLQRRRPGASGRPGHHGQSGTLLPARRWLRAAGAPIPRSSKTSSA